MNRYPKHTLAQATQKQVADFSFYNGDNRRLAGI